MGICVVHISRLDQLNAKVIYVRREIRIISISDSVFMLYIRSYDSMYFITYTESEAEMRPLKNWYTTNNITLHSMKRLMDMAENIMSYNVERPIGHTNEAVCHIIPYKGSICMWYTSENIIPYHNDGKLHWSENIVPCYFACFSIHLLQLLWLLLL